MIHVSFVGNRKSGKIERIQWRKPVVQYYRYSVICHVRTSINDGGWVLDLWISLPAYDNLSYSVHSLVLSG